MRPWQAEVEIDEELVRGLLTEQFPELDASSARLLGEGWDNSVWVVERRLAFRLPRRSVAVPLVERELALLPRLAPRVPVGVPQPTHVGRPSERFPWPFFGCPLLPGTEPADAGLPVHDRAALGGELGRFLRTLHDPATLAAVDPHRALPVDPNRREDMALRAERARASFVQLERLGAWQPPADVEDLLFEAGALPSARSRVLVHGDLHVRHVLVDAGRLSGVIDWGDVCVGDRSIDLSLVWALLPPAGREDFLAEYGPLHDGTRLRARVLSLQLCSMLALYALDVGHANLERECLDGLERTLID